MAFKITVESFDAYLEKLKSEYLLFAPVLLEGRGTFTDTDSVRYQQIDCFADICLQQKSNFSAKEVILPITQTLFYFTEDTWTEPKVIDKKILLFLRSCDIHALKRLDQIYLQNGFVDPYYQKMREKLRLCLIECQEGFDNCFCVSMKTNKAEEYDMFIHPEGSNVYVGISSAELNYFENEEQCELQPQFVQKNKIKVTLPQNLNPQVFTDELWQEYSARCIGCGRCSFVCPTCSCFSMQDIFYRDNQNVGERRRVWASCMVNGFTDMAGGHEFRKTQGERMRFRVMHKVYDYEKRFGQHMCVGCGRCDDACPEYISLATCLNKLNKKQEVASNG